MSIMGIVDLLFCTDGSLLSPPDNDTIYWVDMGLSTISRAKRDQTWREDVVTNGIGRVEGIAVDWIAGEARSHIYTHACRLIRAHVQTRAY